MNRKYYDIGYETAMRQIKMFGYKAVMQTIKADGVLSVGEGLNRAEVTYYPNNKQEAMIVSPYPITPQMKQFIQDSVVDNMNQVEFRGSASIKLLSLNDKVETKVEHVLHILHLCGYIFLTDVSGGKNVACATFGVRPESGDVFSIVKVSIKPESSEQQVLNQMIDNFSLEDEYEMFIFDFGTEDYIRAYMSPIGVVAGYTYTNDDITNLYPVRIDAQPETVFAAILSMKP